MADAPDPASERDLLAPLIEFYVREMGPIPGRLMVALSLLTDLEDSAGWAGQSSSPLLWPMSGLSGGSSTGGVRSSARAAW